MDSENQNILASAIKALAYFKRAFGLDLTPSSLATLYTALRLNLDFAGNTNQPGFDLISSARERYQVKKRDPATLNVDINNFDFDWLVLVNLAMRVTFHHTCHCALDRQPMLRHSNRKRKIQ